MVKIDGENGGETMNRKIPAESIPADNKRNQPGLLNNEGSRRIIVGPLTRSGQLTAPAVQQGGLWRPG